MEMTRKEELASMASSDGGGGRALLHFRLFIHLRKFLQISISGTKRGLKMMKFWLVLVMQWHRSYLGQETSVRRVLLFMVCPFDLTVLLLNYLLYVGNHCFNFIFNLDIIYMSGSNFLTTRIFHEGN